MHHTATYLDLFLAQVRSRVQYRTDFWVGVLGTILQHSANLSVLYLIFAKIPTLGGWTFGQSALLYGFHSLALGLTDFLASGVRELPVLIRSGSLDDMLVKPVSTIVQLLPRFNLQAMGDIVWATTILLWAMASLGIDWSLGTFAYVAFVILCATGIMLGFLVSLYSIGFWIPYGHFMMGLEELLQLARYPLTIYPSWIRLILTIIPFAFTAYIPAASLTGAEPIPVWLSATPLLAAVVSLVVAWSIWTRGLRRYEGGGT